MLLFLDPCLQNFISSLIYFSEKSQASHLHKGDLEVQFIDKWKLRCAVEFIKNSLIRCYLLFLKHKKVWRLLNKCLEFLNFEVDDIAFSANDPGPKWCNQTMDIFFCFVELRSLGMSKMENIQDHSRKLLYLSVSICLLVDRSKLFIVQDRDVIKRVL